MYFCIFCMTRFISFCMEQQFFSNFCLEYHKNSNIYSAVYNIHTSRSHFFSCVVVAFLGSLTLHLNISYSCYLHPSSITSNKHPWSVI